MLFFCVLAQYEVFEKRKRACQGDKKKKKFLTVLYNLMGYILHLPNIRYVNCPPLLLGPSYPLDDIFLMQNARRKFLTENLEKATFKVLTLFSRSLIKQIRSVIKKRKKKRLSRTRPLEKNRSDIKKSKKGFYRRQLDINFINFNRKFAECKKNKTIY